MAVLLLVGALSVTGLLFTTHAVNSDRRDATALRAMVDAQQIRGLLERAGAFAAGLSNALAGEPKPDGRRFEQLVGSATATVGLEDVMWVESVTPRGRRAYEARIGAPISSLSGAGAEGPGERYFPATFITGLQFRSGADMSGLPVLASTLRNPASVFAGTSTGEEIVNGQPGFFLVQGARFGRGPGSNGFLVVFVPAGWLTLNLSEDPRRTGIALDGHTVTGTIGNSASTSRSFEALTHQWRVAVVTDPATTFQSASPWLAVGWPPATALIVYLIGIGIVRRRRAEREVDDIFDLSLDLLCIVGVDGYLKRVNPAFERTLGYDAAELLTRPVLDFVHPDDRGATAEAFARLRQGHRELFDGRYVRADGAVRWLQWNTRPLLERGLMYAAAHDVTGTRLLLQEQAALRRVATLVAEGADAQEIFNAVAVEVGTLLEADATRLLRYEPDGTAAVVAAHGAADQEIGIPAGESDFWGRVAQSSSAAAAEHLRGGDGVLASGIGAAVAAPIVVSTQSWGVIVAVWKRADVARPDAETRIGQFTELVATAVANVESRAQLAESRRRIVATADETRRRIERDLHDGIQQRLVNTVLTLGIAEQRFGPGSEKAAELVHQALENTEMANKELRELTRGIMPASLTEGGLEPALKTVARRSPIPVELDIRTGGRLPRQTEVTAYFVISEALTNAAKHADASVVEVTVQELDGELRLSISDDGVGGADPARGSGLVGLRDRVEAVGGRVTVQSVAGEGTHLTAELPLRPR